MPARAHVVSSTTMESYRAVSRLERHRSRGVTTVELQPVEEMQIDDKEEQSMNDDKMLDSSGNVDQ